MVVGISKQYHNCGLVLYCGLIFLCCCYRWSMYCALVITVLKDIGAGVKGWKLRVLDSPCLGEWRLSRNFQYFAGVGDKRWHFFLPVFCSSFRLLTPNTRVCPWLRCWTRCDILVPCPLDRRRGSGRDTVYTGIPQLIFRETMSKNLKVLIPPVTWCSIPIPQQ